MIVYVDASAVVAVIAEETTSSAIDEAIRSPQKTVMVSDFVIAECSAALARRSRVNGWTSAQIERLHEELDTWTLGVGETTAIMSADIADATAFVRLPGVTLRAPDAIHIAAAHRLGATLLTLDHGMARAAAEIGVPCINPAEADAPGDLKD